MKKGLLNEEVVKVMIDSYNCTFYLENQSKSA